MSWKPLTLSLVTLTLATTLHAAPKPPVTWWRLNYGSTAQGGIACQPEVDGPRSAMQLADGQGDTYRMEDVTENGVVVETTMRGRLTFIQAWGLVALSDRALTWYRTSERCEKVRQEIRAQAKEEVQRRDRYR